MIPLFSPRNALLGLPEADPRLTHTYNSLLLVPTSKLHDSGWRAMTITARITKA